MAILVTGGAGYIGSHVAAELIKRGGAVVIIDNFSTGMWDNVPKGAAIVEGDVGDEQLLKDVFAAHGVDAVMHFAGSIKVEESKRLPLMYYGNNTGNTLALLKVMRAHGVRHFVFSSTAAVYGEPEQAPVREDAPLAPINPYGVSKLMVEYMLRDLASAHAMDREFSYVALRYFNVLGVGESLERGYPIEQNPTHLVRAALSRVFGNNEPLPIFGTDYPTPDGTGVRDYIHISDLVDAHVQALAYLRGGGESVALNVGYGRGYGVFEVVRRVEEVTGKEVPFKIMPRRPGDAAAVMANADKIGQVLRWEPRHANLWEMIESQYRWEKKVRSR